MLQFLLLIFCMVLLALALGLPLILEADSAIPDILSLGILAAMVAVYIWGTDDWWILLPVLLLVALTVRLEREGPPADAMPQSDGGMSRRTRRRFRLWRIALCVQAVLLVAFATLFMLDQGPVAVAFALPALVIAMVAMTLFRFSFHRACARVDYMALPEA
jgi:hypothetical protein